MSNTRLTFAAISMAVLLAACGRSEAVVEIGSAQDAGTTAESSEDTEASPATDDTGVTELTPPPLNNLVRVGSPYYSELEPGLDEDGDGVVNALDLMPLDPAIGWDTDGDLIGVVVDPDADNDGVFNDDDAFPLDPSGWSDINADGVPDSRQWDITGDWEIDRVVSERAQWGFVTDLDDIEGHVDAALTSGISGVLSKEEAEQLEFARFRVQDEGAQELVRWLEDHPSYVSTRTQIRGGGFVVLESSWTQEELVAGGLPLDILEDPSIVRFETRPYSLGEIRAGILNDLEGLAAIEEETGLTFVHEDYDNTYGLTFYAVTHDPEQPRLGEAVELLTEWRASIAEPFRSIIYIDEPDISNDWLPQDVVDELTEGEVAEVPEDVVDEPVGDELTEVLEGEADEPIDGEVAEDSVDQSVGEEFDEVLQGEVDEPIEGEIDDLPEGEADDFVEGEIDQLPEG